jgi:hypothetical protein
MLPRYRRIIRTDTMPRTIRQTSDAVQFGGLRVLVRELPAVGQLDMPGGLDHFCFCYWPRPEGPMILRQGNRELADSTEGSPLLIAPVWPFQPHTSAASLANLPVAGCDSNNFQNSRNSFLFAHRAAPYSGRRTVNHRVLPAQS